VLSNCASNDVKIARAYICVCVYLCGPARENGVMSVKVFSPVFSRERDIVTIHTLSLSFAREEEEPADIYTHTRT